MKTRIEAITHARKLLAMPEWHLAKKADVVQSPRSGRWLVFLRF